MNAPTRVVILGAGPAGLGAALGLARRGFAPTLLEREGRVGGNAGSFEIHGVRVDYGSHRLHPTTDPEILSTLRDLLGADLLERPRRGRILLGGRWIHFPLRPLDLALRAPPRFLMGVSSDLLRKLVSRGRPAGGETFASVLEKGLGPTICKAFYFPYARKIWGLAPEEISPTQAAKRVTAGSLGKLIRRLAPGGSGPGARSSRGTFLYPRQGFGQISERLWEASRAAGARTLLGTRVRRIEVRRGAIQVEIERAGAAETLAADHLWSTIPLGPLVELLDPAPPPEVLSSARSLRQRAMLLVYLVLERGRFSPFDAHYVPDPAIPFTRLSEPKNYAGRTEPSGRTVLCAEIPCAPEDPAWSMEAAELGERVREGMRRAGLPDPGSFLEVVVHRLPSAYPIYRRGWEAHFHRTEEWLDGHPGLLTFGRQGLFAHDNTHHALFMARAAVLCLDQDGHFDGGRWREFRQAFEGHVVED